MHRGEQGRPTELAWEAQKELVPLGQLGDLYAEVRLHLNQL